MHDGKRDVVLQTLQLPRDEGTMSLRIPSVSTAFSIFSSLASLLFPPNEFSPVLIPLLLLSLSSLPPYASRNDTISQHLPHRRREEYQKSRTYPRTGIADVEMIPALLNRELGIRRIADPVAERARLPLELARLVAGQDPVRDLVGGRGLLMIMLEEEQIFSLAFRVLCVSGVCSGG